MVKSRAAGRRVRTGVALSLTELCAADMRLTGKHERGWRTPLDPPDANGSWPALVSAFRELMTLLGATEGRMVVALMPPLTEVRRLDLPPLKREQVQQLLARNASRYFVTAREPQVVGSSVPKRTQRTGPAPVVGAAASARLIAAINGAARETGWTVEAIVPAEVGWGAAATTIWPAFTRGEAHVLVHHADRTDLLRLDAGSLAGVRRFRAGAVDAALIASALRETHTNGTAPRVGMLGAAEQRSALTSSMPPSAATVSTPPAEWARPDTDPMFIAASFATPDEGLALRTEDVAELRARQGRKVSIGIAAGIAALLLFAAMLELWGAKRELAAIQAEREALRPQLQTTLTGRSTLEASSRRLNTLFAAHRESPYVSGVLAAVTDALPEGSYLMSFRTRRDTLVLDGLATNAAQAFDQLVASPDLANVRSIAGVQRQLQDDGTALEHFTVQALMLLPAPWPSSSPSGRPR